LSKHSYKVKPKKNSSKKRAKRGQKKKTPLLKISSVFILLFMFSSIGLYFYSSIDTNQTKLELIDNQKIIKSNNDKIKELQHLLKQTQKELVQIDTNYLSEIEDLKSQQKAPKSSKKSPIIKRAKKIVKGKNPKLVIIIDDVVSSSQVKAIKSIPLHITMSFLPPNPNHPSSAKIAKNLNHIMIHLPLEAFNSRFTQKDTLVVGDSVSEISKRISTLKQLYPQVKYINNHTGSKFSADYKSMSKLLKVLDKNELNYIDSKTTGQTTASQVAHENSIDILVRDIFLDNKPDIAYIHKQLKKAVKKAKKHRYAIAIAHPHHITIQALKKAQKILQGVDVVYIDNL
jgi:polysaccharide deacetylase 2 family uncharacterized protein YibQ